MTEEGETDIHSALFNAQDFFRAASNQDYNQLNLIIFSDMGQNVAEESWARDIDFNGVNVVIAMVPIDSRSDEEVAYFVKNREFWENWFLSAHTLSFDYLSVSNSEQSLLDILGGNGSD